MKPAIKFTALFLLFTGLEKAASAQFLVSQYKPKNQTEKTILVKIKALPEIKEWLAAHKKSHADLIFNIPDSPFEDYSIQIGIGEDMFRTSYWLYINPKTYAIYFNDFFDESGSKAIPLEQWRYWRNKPGFFDLHKWQHGKLIILKVGKTH